MIGPTDPSQTSGRTFEISRAEFSSILIIVRLDVKLALIQLISVHVNRFMSIILLTLFHTF